MEFDLQELEGAGVDAETGVGSGAEVAAGTGAGSEAEVDAGTGVGSGAEVAAGAETDSVVGATGASATGDTVSLGVSRVAAVRVWGAFFKKSNILLILLI
jgi:hypothetical protein